MLDGVRGFVFDVDGTLVHRRGPDGGSHPQPGAVEVLAAIRASGRPLVLFTNGSSVGAESIARGLTQDGLPIADDEVLTPIESATAYLRRRHPDASILHFGTAVITERLARAGIPQTDGEDAEVVFVTQPDRFEIERLELAARAIAHGAPLLTASYARGYAGANGMIYSRGAMVAAALAKVTGRRPKVLGKPSRPALAAVRKRLGLHSNEIAVIGDDLGMDIALGRMGGSRTVLVRSGITGQIALERIPERRRPDAVVDGVGDLLAYL